MNDMRRLLKKIKKKVPKRRTRILAIFSIFLILSPFVIRSFLLQDEVSASSLYWKFDEGYGSTTNDTSGNDNSGTITNATWKTSDLCRTEKCLYFDGSGDYVSRADDSDLDFADTDDFTIIGWFRHPVISTDPDLLIAKHESGIAGGYKVYMDADGDIVFGIDDDGTWDPTDILGGSLSKNYDDNKWHHFAAVKDGTSGIYLYIDGALIDSDTSITETGTLANAATFYLGIDSDGSSYGWEGFVDEIKVHREVRTLSQIKADYLQGSPEEGSSSTLGTRLSGGETFLSDGLVGYWKLDETSGDAADASGNGNDLTDVSSTTYTNAKFGNGADIESSNSQYLYAADSSSLSVTSDLTISAWINPESNTASTQYDIAGKWDESNETYLLAQYGDEIRFYLDSSSNYVETSSANLSTGTWYHVTASYEAGSQTAKIFVNGIEETTTTTGTIPSSLGDDAGRFHIGAEDSSNSTNVTFQVGGNTDDGTEENDTTWYDTYGNSNTHFVADLTTPYDAGYRWTNVTIPQGSTITSATFQPQSYSYQNSGVIVETTLLGVDVDNASTFGSSNRPSQLTKTTATVTWDVDVDNDWIPLNEFKNSPDVSSIVQEIVNRGSWASGNALAIVWEENSGDSGDGLYVYDYNSGSSNAAKLDVTYSAAPNNIYDGIVDEVRVYNRSLSQQEAKQISEWAPGPVVELKMDENTGTTTAYDTSTYANDGTLSNITESDWIPGVYGSGLDIEEGDTSCINVGSDTSVDNIFVGGATVMAWVNIESAGQFNNGRIVDKGENQNDGWTFLVNSNSNDLAFRHTPSFGNDAIWSTDTTLNTNEWTHVAVTYNQDSTSNDPIIYFNGVAQAITEDDAPDATNMDDSDRTMYIGCREGNARWFDGLIDEFKLYNYERTPGQIIEDMNAGHPLGGSPVGSAVTYLKFDEGYGTTAHDESDNQNDFTLSSASWSDGKINRAFNGTGSTWLVRGNDPDHDFSETDDFSISLWFKSDSATNPSSAVEFLVESATVRGGSGLKGYTIYANTSGNIVFGIDDDTDWGSTDNPTPDDSVTSSEDIYDGTWHHVVATKTGTSRIDLYIDGHLDDSDTSLTATASIDGDSNIRIGDDDGDVANAFNGDIDEFKIYRSDLTNNQVLIDMNANSAVNFSTGYDAADDITDGAGDSPVGYWTFDENTGTGTDVVKDLSGNENHGTTNGTMTESDWVPGKLGSALDFDGSDDYVSTANLTDIAGNFTLCAWFNWNGTESTTTDHIASDHESDANDVNFGIYRKSSDDKIYGVFRDTSDTWHEPSTDTTITATGWHHVCAVNDGTDFQMYLDGLADGTAADVSGTTPKASTGTFAIGQPGSFSDSAHRFNGAIDEVKLYDYARTPAQIAYDYNRGKPVGWWKFDECSGSTANDSSGNGNSGTIQPESLNNTAVGSCGSGTSTEMWNDGTTGKRNGSLGFDGADDYVDLGTTPTELALDEYFTVTAWLKWDSSATNQDVFYASGSTGNNYWSVYLDASNSNKITFSEDGGTNIAGNSSVAQDTWIHVAVVKDGDSGTNIAIYLNGQADGTGSVGTSPTPSGTATIGKRGEGNVRHFPGLIDDLRVYNYPLSQNQILKIIGEGTARFGPNEGEP